MAGLFKCGLVFGMLAGLLPALAGCGGDGAGSIASAPPPIPAPIPAPAPALPPVSSTVTPVTAIPAVAVIEGIAPGDSNGLNQSTKLLSSVQITIGQDATGGYSITLPVPTQQNGAWADVVRKIDFAVNTRAEGRPAFVARQTEASTAPGGDNSFNPDSRWGLQYAKFASLLVCNTSSGTGCNSEDGAAAEIVFGTVTPLAEIPLSGSASYKGGFQAFDFDGATGLSGSILLQLDFASHNVTGSLSGVSGWLDDGFSARTSPQADFALQGQLGNNGFLSGTAKQAPAPGAYQATWSAGLFGPQAAEVAGVIRVEQPSSPYWVATGTFGAIRQ